MKPAVDPAPATRSRSQWPTLLFIFLIYPLSWYAWLLTPGPNSDLNPLGPLAAALIVSGLSHEFRDFIRRIVRIRSSWTTYAIATLLPIALCLMAAFGATMLGAASPWLQARIHWTDTVGAFVVAFFFVALGEEPAWRGFLFAKLNLWLPGWLAALAVVPVWALWHLPLIGTQLQVQYVAPFLILLAAGAVILGWLTARTHGGVLPAMLCHATINAVGGNFMFRFFKGADLTKMWWVYSGLWACAALLIGIHWVIRGVARSSAMGSSADPATT